jgi:hypothetical protein
VDGGAPAYPQRRTPTSNTVTLVDPLDELEGGTREVRDGDDRPGEPRGDPQKVKTGAGKRVQELALNRAIVVLTVAAWQAYVQDITREAIDLLKPAAPPMQPWNLTNAQVTRAIQLFSTPNAENTRDLLSFVGFDPRPSWTWKVGQEALSSASACERMNRWLQVRHAIAHGHDALPDVPMLAKLNDGSRTLRRANAEACMTFFERVVEKTDAAIRSQFAVP